MSDGSVSKITFAAQPTLPKLPIPDLESTCQHYIDALLPLQPPEDHRQSLEAVEHFLKHDGPRLQAQLMRYAQGKDSYVEQFCECS